MPYKDPEIRKIKQREYSQRPDIIARRRKLYLSHNHKCLDCDRMIGRYNKRCNICNIKFVHQNFKITKEGREKISQRMKSHNPMKNKAISIKVRNKNLERGTFENKRKFMILHNPMKNKSVSEKAFENRDLSAIAKKASISRRANGTYKRTSERFKNGDSKRLLKIAREKKPTKLEKKLMSLLKKGNLPFEYTGDRGLWLYYQKKRANPDFINYEKKIVIEVNGNYWHGRPGSRAKDLKKYHIYRKLGYKFLVIWEDELKNKNKEQNIIDEIRQSLERKK